MTELNVGAIIGGRYRIERKLGSGGMGSVFSAVHERLGHRVAIKVMRAGEGASEMQVARFLAEAKAAALLDSSHVVRVLDFGETETRNPYIVMEYLKGTDFERILAERGPLPLDEVLPWFLDALEGVAMAHSRGIVHRDLKPANIFLAEGKDGSRTVKVLDFGLAKLAHPQGGSITGTNDVFGSPEYMAPEQLKASKMVDARADIWSLGVTLFQLLTGKSPFHRTNPAEYIAAVLISKPFDSKEFGVDVPDSITRAIEGCLEKKPEERIQDVRMLVAMLEAHRSYGALARIDQMLIAARVSERTAAAKIWSSEDGEAATRAVSPPGLATSTQPAALRSAAQPSRGRRRWLGVSVAALAALGAITWYVGHSPNTAVEQPSEIVAPPLPGLFDAAREAVPPRDALPLPSSVPLPPVSASASAPTASHGPSHRVRPVTRVVPKSSAPDPLDHP